MHPAVAVPEDLHLDVTRVVDEPLEVDLVRFERSESLGLGDFDRPVPRHGVDATDATPRPQRP